MKSPKAQSVYQRHQKLVRIFSIGVGLLAVVVATGCGSDNDATSRPPKIPLNAVTAGGDHSCGLKIDNTVICWGRNVYGQVDVPVGEFNAVTAGGEHSCGLKTDNTVICWGNNE